MLLFTCLDYFINFILKLNTAVMNTILIPTDFSETSKNAAVYAIDLALVIGIPKIVFYHFYQTSLIYTPAGELDEMATIEPHRVESIEKLNAFIESLGNIPLEVEMYQGAESIDVGITEVAHLSNADLIVMGIKGGGIFKETVLGSHTLRIAKELKVPVLLVPATAKLDKYEKVTFLSDLKNVEKNTPVHGLKTFLDHSSVKLSILHLLKANEKVDDSNKEKELLSHLLKDYAPTFAYKESHHYTDDIIDFVSENKIDIIAILPKTHDLLETIFNDHTKKLAFHSKVPLLILHK